MPANYQQSRPAGGRLIAFIVLVAISLALTIVYAREGDEGPVHKVQDAFMSVAAPINALGAHAGVAIDGVATSIQDASAEPETLSALREQNEQLRRLVAEAEEYRQEAERLQGLLDMKRVSNVQGKIAHVMGSSDTAWNQSITIDLGSADGVEPGMTVMGSTGVLGQATRVMPHSSVVRLLTDPNSGAAVKIQSSRADAIVRGSLDGRLHLGDVEVDQVPEIGDVVITSGLGGSYQAGLIVGTVVSVGKSSGSMAGDIIVNPNASASLLEEVIVVMDEAALAKANGESSDEEDDAEGSDEVEEAAEAAAAATVVEGAVQEEGEEDIPLADKAAEVAAAG